MTSFPHVFGENLLYGCPIKEFGHDEDTPPLAAGSFIEFTAGQYVREYQSLYNRTFPTRGNIQQIGSGQTHKKEIISDYLNGYLVPTICQKTNHSKDAVEPACGRQALHP
ncbi:MAG: DUF1670 domain-containing protein [Bacteroidetes bacterium]|nr:DUF1670 domain-containing protein [Bacteroidota bacterium]